MPDTSTIDSSLILIIDDSYADFKIMKRSFSKAGLNNHILHIDNGEEALDYVLNRGKYEDKESYSRPGIILLDLNMPTMNGKEVLKELKENPHTRRIPVVVLTTSSDEKDIDACYDFGANSYIVKPVSASGFYDAMKTLRDYWIEIAIVSRSEA